MSSKNDERSDYEDVYGLVLDWLTISYQWRISYPITRRLLKKSYHVKPTHLRLNIMNH